MQKYSLFFSIVAKLISVGAFQQSTEKENDWDDLTFSETISTDTRKAFK